MIQENNLKNISLEIEKHKFHVVTGNLEVESYH